jgi:signal transduction histidine kinase
LTGGLDLFRSHFRVATISTVVVAVAYLLVAGVIDVIATQNVTMQVDNHLRHRLLALQNNLDEPITPLIIPPTADRSFDAPPASWVIDPTGSQVSASALAPTLPQGLRHVSGPLTVQIAGSPMRLVGGPLGAAWLVVGQDANFIDHASRALITAEAIAAGPLLLFVFVGALVISRRSVAPVEEAHRRQLAFTADASHELRTPLAVIEAETSLALQKARTANSYRESLERISAESARLRQLVDDLLWLARFDAEPVKPTSDLVDLGTQVRSSLERFRNLAGGRSLHLEAQVDAGALVTAPGEWLDRLVAVLLDNACRYSPRGGSVRVEVVATDAKVHLVVHDSGPGIPRHERAHIFDRFRRATSVVGGTGLGLAIADAVVKGTNGRWEVGESSLGGARMAVSWPAAGPKESRPFLPQAARANRGEAGSRGSGGD